MGQVYGENVECCPPDRRATSKHGSVPLEMVLPFVLSRMKQSYNYICLGVYSRNVRPFVVIASKTRQRKIPGFVSPMMFAGNYVINLKGEEIILLRHSTVFAD